MVVGKAGLVVNLTAGRGKGFIEELLLQLLPKLESVPTVIAKGTLEAAIAGETKITAEIVDRPDSRGFEYVARLTETVLAQGVDTVVGVGGDGTLCSIANAMIAQGTGAKLLGIGAGSANVGPLITVRSDELDVFEPDKLRERSIYGIGVRVNGKPLSIAFNDIVFSNLFLGTEKGIRVNLDAGAMLKGERKVIQPTSVCGDEIRVYKNGELVFDSRDAKIAQIIVSPINDIVPYRGKATSGLMCWGPYLGSRGILAAASAVLIRTQVTKEELTAIEPLELRHVSFGSEDLVEVTGLKNGAVLIADGNPTLALSRSDRIGFCLKPSVVQAFRLIGS